MPDEINVKNLMVRVKRDAALRLVAAKLAELPSKAKNLKTIEGLLNMKA